MTTPTEPPVTDTPRTDAAKVNFGPESNLCCYEQAIAQSEGYEILARNLERQLTAANAALAAEREKNAKVRDEALEEAAIFCEQNTVEITHKGRRMGPALDAVYESVHHGMDYAQSIRAMKSKGM